MMLRCIFCVLSSLFLMAIMLQAANGQDVGNPAPAPAPELNLPRPTPNKPAAKTTVHKKIIYKEKSYFDFEDTLINGNLRKPDGSFVFRKNQSTFSSALNLRRSFIPELKESSENAR